MLGRVSNRASAAHGTAERAVALAVATFGKLDIIENNAGRILYKNLVDLSREECPPKDQRR